MHKKRLKHIPKSNKTLLITFPVLFLLMLTLIIVLPTAARFKNRTSIVTSSVWDGSIATKYKKGDGTTEDPYVISSGSELAYFAQELNNTTYEDTYFKISNNIVLNAGIFGYDDEDGLIYILNDDKFYIKNNTNEYYNDLIKEEVVGTLNNFNSLNNFKGNLDGGYYRIYGLFIASASDEVGLFTNLEGNIENLYVENTIINGGYITGGIASSANEASLKNIMFDGVVFGNETEEIIKSFDLEDYSTDLDDLEIEDLILIENELLLRDAEIVKTTLYGTVDLINTSQSVNLKINNTLVSNKDFELNFGQNLYETLDIEIIPSILEGELKLSNLRYEIIYKTSNTAGLIGYAKNVSLDNVINKGKVIGDYNASGLISYVRGAININNSYNKGIITSNHNSAGLINTFDKSLESNINKSYNEGYLDSLSKSSLIGNIYTSGDILISNVISNSDEYIINSIIDTNVIVNDSYTTKEDNHIGSGFLDGLFNYALLEDIVNDTDIKDYLMYNEFISFNDLEINEDNVWLTTENGLPILFIDDSKDYLVSINASIYTWNNYSMELDYFNFSTNIMFNIEDIDILNPSKKICYYILDTEEALLIDDIKSITEWEEYNDIVKINDEGTYVIYVKATDYNDREYYLNTDYLVLDQSNEGTSLKLDNYVWSDFNTNPDTIFINDDKIIELEVGSDIVNAYYYVTNSKKTIKSLTSMSVNNWVDYVDGINLTSEGKYIVYVKIIDIQGKSLYLNTDLILYEGYNAENIYDVVNISKNSSIKINYAYNSDYLYKEIEEYGVVTNYLLPEGTYIELSDNINDRLYYLNIDSGDDLYGYENSCEEEDLTCIKQALYPFSLFKEVGSTSDKFIIPNYYNSGIAEEDFTITLYFDNTEISTDLIGFKTYLNALDINSNIIRHTLNSDIREYNILVSSDYKEELDLTTDFSQEEEIMYNSNSMTKINLDTKINHKMFNLNKVYDTRLFNKKIGFEISFIKNNELVDYEYLKNIQVKVDNNLYSPDKQGIFRIRLNNIFSDSLNELEIITLDDNNNLKEGLYYLKLSTFVSNDGLYGYKYLENAQLIPIRVIESDIKNTFIYDVSSQQTILNKNKLNEVITYKALLNTSVVNPNIRVSLYEKKELSAYNQEYRLINISNYITNSLELISNNVYYAAKYPVLYASPEYLFNQFDLEFIMDNLSYNSYKLKFDFYNDNIKIKTIERVFIVR